MPDEIGTIVHALRYTKLKGNQRMNCQRRLSYLCSLTFPCHIINECGAIKPYPLAFETELNLPSLTLAQLQTAFNRCRMKGNLI